jgi:ankyrin repeat protein
MTFDEVHKLIKKGDLMAVRAALDGGVDANLSNKFSWTLLMLAALEGNTPIAELLIARGAEIDKANAAGETALSLTACGGHLRLMKVLLAHGSSKGCRPHGTALKDWIKISSGLPPKRVRSVLDVLDHD